MVRGLGFGVIRRFTVAFLLFLCIALVCGCGNRDTALNDKEAAAIADISGMDAAVFSDITREVLTKERAAKFPAATKVYKNGDLCAFIVKPVAYNGPITLALVIDGGSSETIGMRIVEHNETLHYVRDMESSWFVERFAGRHANEYLVPVKLTAQESREIVAITGATVTTEGIVNGVNAAFGVYREFVLGQEAEAVPLMVRFEPGKGDGPTETESIAIRAYGTVLAEISLVDIRELPSVRRTMSIHSTAGVTQHSFRGTLLSNVLNLADPYLVDEYSMALAVGVDDYISGISMDEIRAENNVFVMYEDNDEPLLKKNGEPGAMRIVVINDIFGQRFTNYLLEIVLESDKTGVRSWVWFEKDDG